MSYPDYQDMCISHSCLEAAFVLSVVSFASATFLSPACTEVFRTEKHPCSECSIPILKPVPDTAFFYAEIFTETTSKGNTWTACLLVYCLQDGPLFLRRLKTRPL